MADPIASAIQMLQGQQAAPSPQPAMPQPMPTQGDPIGNAIQILQSGKVAPPPMAAPTASQQPAEPTDIAGQRAKLQQMYKSGDPGYKAYAIKLMGEHPWGSGAAQDAYNLGGKVTDWTGSPLAGWAANTAAQAVPSFLTSFRLGEPASLLETPAKWLMQKAVKPSNDSLKSSAAQKALADMLREDISPTSGGMGKASDIASQMESKVQQVLQGSTAEVPLEPVNQGMLPAYERALVQGNPNADVKAVGDVWREFADSPLARGQESIPVQLAHAIKQGTQQSIGSKGYKELGTATVQGQKALAAALRQGVAEAAPEVSAPLAREASAMNILDVARNKALISGNKNVMGLGALRLGDNPLSTIGFMADRWPYAQGLLARLLYRAGQPQALAPAAVAGTNAINQLTAPRGAQ